MTKSSADAASAASGEVAQFVDHKQRRPAKARSIVAHLPRIWWRPGGPTSGTFVAVLKRLVTPAVNRSAIDAHTAPSATILDFIEMTDHARPEFRSGG